MPQFIYTMKNLRKVTPQGKEILRGIWLSFYHGAKIGVLGANGAGKSTLLRIMAGVDKDFAGESFLGEGFSVGYLPQEPVLDPQKNVRQHVEEAVTGTRKLLERFDELTGKMGEDLSGDEMDKVMAEYTRVQDAIEAANGWELDRALEISIPPGPRLGDIVVEAKGLTKAYGDKLLIDELSFIVPPAGIVGIIGPNGAGKTTLFRMIVGQEKPDSGALRLGETVALSYVDQSRETLNGDRTLFEEISDGGRELLMVGKREINARAYASAFNFRGADQQKKVRDLSGGERNRLHLAKLLKSGGNLLLLDEPTNDLDVDTLRALEEAVLDFAGCVMVISHDRWFLDRIATHILAFEGNSEVVWYEGNYQEYAADYHKRKGASVDQPHRIRYKKLVQ
jgi:ATPase subunit of ABC transporter with duplicated ATPase domains